jgi:hypothetical protein
MRVIRSLVIVCGGSRRSYVPSVMSSVVRSFFLLVSVTGASGKSGAIYESRAKYKLRFSRAMKIFEPEVRSVW